MVFHRYTVVRPCLHYHVQCKLRYLTCMMCKKLSDMPDICIRFQCVPMLMFNRTKDVEKNVNLLKEKEVVVYVQDVLLNLIVYKIHSSLALCSANRAQQI